MFDLARLLWLLKTTHLTINPSQQSGEMKARIRVSGSKRLQEGGRKA
jgi:hypothetical protein